MEAQAGKASAPHPRTNWGWGFDAVQSFFGAAWGLDAGLPLGAVVPPLGGNGVGEAAALRAQFRVHPQVGINFGGGGYDPWQEALYEGAVEGLTITRPIKPLCRAARATSSTTGLTGAPQGTPPSAAANVRNALGAMQTIGRQPDFEVCAFIIRS